jgi:hypothetical protein
VAPPRSSTLSSARKSDDMHYLPWIQYAVQLTTLIGCGCYWFASRNVFQPVIEQPRSEWYAEQADWRK